MKTLPLLAASFLLPLTLSGCILAAAGAGAATSAIVVNDKRSLHTMADDQTIEYTALKEIQQSSELRTNTHISVVAFDHAVLLVGQVPNVHTAQRVQALVQALPKVARVYNQLEVDPPTSLLIRSNDSWVTAKIKSQMMGTKNLNSGQIKVVTENSNVYLMGLVSHQQGEKAANVARKVDGVQKVITLFEYTQG